MDEHRSKWDVFAMTMMTFALIVTNVHLAEYVRTPEMHYVCAFMWTGLCIRNAYCFMRMK